MTTRRAHLPPGRPGQRPGQGPGQRRGSHRGIGVPPMSRRAAGFTLIEVLTAIFVLTITIPVLMQAYSVAGDVASFSRQRSEALAVAQTHLDELVATSDWLNDTPSGDDKPGPTSYHWQSALNTWTNSDPAEDTTIQQLTVTVSWQHNGQPFQLALDTLVYNAANSSISTTTAPANGGLP